MHLKTSSRVSAFFLLFARGNVAQSTSNSESLANVAQAFSKAHVVPDVLESFSPTALLDIVFTSQSQTVNVTPGVNLTMQQTANEPQFFLTPPNGTLQASTSYVLAIVDPDAPTPQNTSISQFRHFLGGHFQVNTSTSLLMNTSAALSDFVPPTPPDGSDPHRYVAVIYKQPDGFDTSATPLVNASTPRTNFNLTVFAERVGLGNPIAGNFFLTGPSDGSGSGGASQSGNAASTVVASWFGTMAFLIFAVLFHRAYSTNNSVDMAARPTSKLPAGANRILFVKNLNYQITGEDLYDLFGRYGSIRQIRIGNEAKTKGTAFVVFDDVMDAKNALDHLNGFHLQERYIVVLYHMPAKQDAAAAKADLARREEELAQLKKKHDIGDP
ncbi:pre-mrna branch site protein p14 [Moniliophthora roreri]|nr:pre-mrna branch site protein p14 [Moniliophthora roreri]